MFYRESATEVGGERSTEEATEIVPMTPEIVAELKAEAFVALNGDRTCSLDNMAKSCFASETCAQGQSPFLTLDAISRSLHSYVAVCTSKAAGVRTFVGCLSAGLCTESTMCMNLFPLYTFQSGDLLISNLCVAETYRRRGVGERLVEAACARSPGVYLFVARGPSLEARSDKLLRWYKSLGFEEVGSCPAAYLMHFRCAR